MALEIKREKKGVPFAEELLISFRGSAESSVTRASGSIFRASGRFVDGGGPVICWP